MNLDRLKQVRMKLITVFLCLVWICGCVERNPVKTGMEGKPLPSFNLLLPDSTTYFNTAEIRGGTPIVLYYFSPRCPYCHAQMEDIVDNISTLKDIKFYVITSWPFSEMNNFYKHYQLRQYPNITVGYDYTYFFEKFFKITGVPYTAIYAKDKKLREAFIGKISARLIRKGVSI